ncbi:YicC family protein [Lentisphaera marina]|uniref:YicC/YloC family endoribonuclease n=1 Tax=Lentisphaera marina TaxID=1111041 RepID=UPI0023656073|nr:YicC/YloC family endoribonuclease [Lentisphaera marina]MDD7986939.1 YicC family protein [Lentisphaera marina]
MKSMTGYGRGEATLEDFSIVVELSTVNRKGLDMRVNFPREYLALEGLIRKKIGSVLARGMVTGSLTLSFNAGAQSANINKDLMQSYIEQLKEVHQNMGMDFKPDTVRLMSLPGVLEDSGKSIDEDLLMDCASKALDKALSQLMDNRGREGDAMKNDFLERYQTMCNLHCDIEQTYPQALADYRERLTTRIKEAALDVEIDDDRLAQELVIYSDRSDITEEVVRLNAHLKQFKVLLEKDEPIGREMDFLMQEMGREVNTTGSKSSNAALSALIVAFKAELEKCREQMANVE